MEEKKTKVTKQMKWIKKGLKFLCTQCGNCCTGGPGFVWLSKKDILKLCQYLSMDEKTFLKTFCKKVGNRISLKERSNFDCIFLQKKRCSVHLAKPDQCKHFPWWLSNLQSQKDWEEAGKYCEGINHEQGEFFSLEEIQKRLHTSVKDDEQTYFEEP